MSKKIALSEATREQMMAFAESTLGISVPHNIGADTLRARIAETWGKDEITVEDAPEQPAMHGSAPNPLSPQQSAPGRNKVKLIIHKTDEPGGSEPVPVGVNGKVMLIPRGEPVEIPEDYYHALSNASRLHYDTDENGSLKLPPREIHQYPHQRVA